MEPIISDGTIYKLEKVWKGRKNYSYYIELADEWLENVKAFSSWIESLTQRKGNISFFRGCFRYRIGLKKLVKELNKIGIPYGRKSKIIKIPPFVYKEGKKCLENTIGAILTFDGTVKIDGCVEFSTVSFKLFKQIIKFLEENKVNFSIFSYKITRFSDSTKYGFYSRDFQFFQKILFGEKKKRLKFIMKGKNMSIKELMHMFPVRKTHKARYLIEIYQFLKKENTPKPKREIRRYIEEKYKTKISRNTIGNYLKLLINSHLIRRIKRGWYIWEERL